MELRIKDFEGTYLNSSASPRQSIKGNVLVRGYSGCMPCAIMLRVSSGGSGLSASLVSQFSFGEAIGLFVGFV